MVNHPNFIVEPKIVERLILFCQPLKTQKLSSSYVQRATMIFTVNDRITLVVLQSGREESRIEGEVTSANSDVDSYYDVKISLDETLPNHVLDTETDTE